MQRMDDRDIAQPELDRQCEMWDFGDVKVSENMDRLRFLPVVTVGASPMDADSMI